MKSKQLKDLKVSNSDKGEVTAVFATLGVIDKHGDVTRPGAFSPEPVLISHYSHESWFGQLPVGRGKISERGDEAVFEGQFFLNTTMGRDHFEVVKETPDLMQWSYGFDVLESAFGQEEGRDVQYLDKLKVWEVSPVLVGAGEGTRTTGTKAAGQTFEDQLKSVITDVDEILERAASVVTLRTQAGRKAFAEDKLLMLTDLSQTMKQLDELLQKAAVENDPDTQAEIMRQFARAELGRANAFSLGA